MSGIEGDKSSDLGTFSCLSVISSGRSDPQKMLLWLLTALFKWKCASSENQMWLIQLGVRSSFWLIQSHIVCLLCWSSAVSLCLTDMMYGYNCSSFRSIRNTLEEGILNCCDRRRRDFFGLLMVEFRTLSIFSWILVTLAGRPLFPLLL